jgi:hypothetical protein
MVQFRRLFSLRPGKNYQGWVDVTLDAKHKTLITEVYSLHSRDGPVIQHVPYDGDAYDAMVNYIESFPIDCYYEDMVLHDGVLVSRVFSPDLIV